MTADTLKPRKILAVADISEMQIALHSALSLAETHGAAVESIVCVEPPHDLSILSRLSGENSDKLIEATVEHIRREVRARLAKVAPERQVDLSVAVGKTYLEIIRHVARLGCDFVVKMAEPLSGMNRFLFASNDQHLLRKCPCPVWLQTPLAPERPKRVLAAIDLDVWDADEPATLRELNRRVIEAACVIAGAPDAEVVILHAWDAPGEGMVWAFSSSGDPRLSADNYVNEILTVRQMAMDRFLVQVRKDIGPSPRLVPRLARGAPEEVIPEQSRALGADAVVMGTVARTGLSGVFIGNTAENIINSLECPVLAVKPEGFVSPLLSG